MEEILQDKFILSVIGFFIGIILGSFATALIYRLPRDIDWVFKRSSCPKCNTHLNLIDLFPVFSYVFFGGKCRYCKSKIGINYLLIELLIGLGFAVILLHFGASWNAIFICSVYFLTIVLSAIDFEHYIIPDGVNISFLLVGILYSLVILDREYSEILFSSLFYGFLSLGLRWFMFAWKKKEGLGMGDVKFFFAVGAFLGFEQLPGFLMLAGVIGIATALIWNILKKGKLFPFGPALSISLLFCVAFPEMINYIVIYIQQLIYN